MRTLSALAEARFEVNAISVFSCWEVAMLHQKGRLSFSCSLDDWFEAALAYPALSVQQLTLEIAVGSTRLPGEFHGDPADRIIVQTARSFDCLLVTTTGKFLPTRM
jgi:PIN domain nuclease of toxin-antitoxin system